MALSSRETAPSPFKQTWNETDAAFLDPTLLPIAKVPRAWERKEETKTTIQGKQKKVWRRYTTRSRASQAESEEDEEEMRDSRARAVKKLQRMSPGAMEISATMLHGGKRAFKATRWDRRKSVLPRKKAATSKPAIMEADDENDSDDETNDAIDADASNLSFSAIDMVEAGKPVSLSTLIPDEKDRRGTFTFTMGDDAVEMPAQDGYDLSAVHCVPTHASPESETEQDATLMHFFRSPTKTTSPTKRRQSSRIVVYPELPEVREATPEVVAVLLDEHHKPSDSQHETHVEDDPFEVDDKLKMVEEVSITVAGDSHLYNTNEEPQPNDSLLESASVSYPLLPTQVSAEDPAWSAEQLGGSQDAEMSDDISDSMPEQCEDAIDLVETVDVDESQDEDVTEASLQLDIQRDLENEKAEQQTQDVETTEAQHTSEDDGEQVEHEPTSAELAISSPCKSGENDYDTTVPTTSGAAVDSMDIAAGLTLGVSVPSLREPTPRKFRSPSPPPLEQGPDDATMTIVLDDDTAVLKDFLSRAAANKANKAAVISRRESLQNRRDSDVVRHALASPRKVLEDKDPNSPSKYDNDATLDLSQTLTLNMDSQTASSPMQEQDTWSIEDSKASRSRRSSRARKSRLPAPSSALPAGPPKIAVRRADGGELVVLKKTDAQELSLHTRANTRKNKQGAFAVSVRLLKLSHDARTAEAGDDSTTDSVPSAMQVAGKKYVRWDEQLAYYQESTDTMANMLADAESLAAPDELSLPIEASTPNANVKSKVARTKSSVQLEQSSTPKARKVRGLGSTNGTPGKGLLTSGSLLPDAVQEERSAAQPQSQRLPKPKVSKPKKMPVASTPSTTMGITPTPVPAESKLPILDVAPVGVEPTGAAATKERRSRLATPKKVKLPQPIPTVLVEGKENQQRSGIAMSTPKKGIPMPSVVAPGNGGVETGLPRRRARKL